MILRLDYNRERDTAHITIDNDPETKSQIMAIPRAYRSFDKGIWRIRAASLTLDGWTEATTWIEALNRQERLC